MRTAIPRKPHPSAKRLLALLEKTLSDHKAEDIVSIDLAGKSSMADFMVVASGRSNRQVAALADNLVEVLKSSGHRVSVEGKAHGDWVLVDAGEVIVHLFRPEVRNFYQLEKMWQMPAEGAAPKPKRSAKATATPSPAADTERE